MTTRLLHRCDQSDLIQDLSRVPWQVLETFDDLDDVVEAWSGLFLEVLNQPAPVRKVRVQAKSLPWIDDELRMLMRQRNWLHKKAIKSGDDDLLDNYRAVRNISTVFASAPRSMPLSYESTLMSYSPEALKQQWSRCALVALKLVTRNQWRKC